MIDVEAIRAATDLVALVGRYVDLRKEGTEWAGLCPFHAERTPSFTVSPQKGFVHCFGCGAHHDAIGFLMQAARLSFVEACAQLGAAEARDAETRRPVRAPPRAPAPGAIWAPVTPAPDDAPLFAPDVEGRVWNPKRGRWWTVRPSRADAYRDARGRLLGYVLRVDFDDGKKITPQVTWCIGPDGSQRWCTRPFQTPRPLCGLDDLAARLAAPVLVVEGEKCRAAGAGALTPYVVVTWPGGAKGLRHVDWTPLRDREVVLWPDADRAGLEAMLGYEHYSGAVVDGVAQHAWRAGCASLRMVDPEGQPKGWDLADALAEGWTPRQLAAWAAARVVGVDVVPDKEKRAA